MKILCIFAKPPIPGKTKKRLAESIGDEAAANLSKIMLNILIGEGKTSIADEFFLYIPNEYSTEDFKGIDISGIKIRYQKGDSLGEKMSNMFAECCHPNNQVVLIGSDCISITVKSLNKAFEHLQTNQVVIQPAEDGGYVLIGQSSYFEEIFNGPKWGSATVFEDTMKILGSKANSTKILPKAFDIDVKEDLYKLHLINNQEIKKWLEKYSF